jgi:hypothetical protein
MRRPAGGLVLVLLAFVPLRGAHAQVRASERAEVKQTVDGTTITLNYSRPRLRGRTDVFGTQVPWGEIWTPGANDATTLAVSKDVTIDGNAVAKGKYSVWIVMAPGDWIMVLDQDTTLFHMNGPKERPGQVRFKVRKESAPVTDVLTWSFPDVRASRARLVLQWATTAVPLDIAVTPTQSITVAPAVGHRVEGRYDLQFKPPPPPKDTSHASEQPPMPTRMNFTVRQDGGRLRARMDPPLWPGAEELVLVRKSDQLFLLAEADDDGLKELWDWAALEFAFTDGRATGFVVRMPNDEAIASAKRVP